MTDIINGLTAGQSDFAKTIKQDLAKAEAEAEAKALAVIVDWYEKNPGKGWYSDYIAAEKKKKEAEAPIQGLSEGQSKFAKSIELPGKRLPDGSFTSQGNVAFTNDQIFAAFKPKT